MKTVSRATFLIALLALPALGGCHDDTHPDPEVENEDLELKWGFEWAFTGISTFAHLPHVKCLTHPSSPFDIAILGAPFDTATSYRPGARFGARAIRTASARNTPFRGFNARAGINPLRSWATVVDCGDIPITPFDNALALRQMDEAFLELGSRGSAYRSPSTSEAEGRPPRLVTLGGDHAIALPELRALNKIHGGPVAVLHFDAHLDTWHPAKYPSAWTSEQAAFNHGSMFWIASNEGLILNGSSVHAGLRTRLSGVGWDDYDDDDRQGFLRISSDDIDDIGTKGIIAAILDRIGDAPCYLSVDIDVIDPGLAPGTGTPEPGGWTTRELIRILRGIEDLNLVGADVVEVSPAYDDRGEGTALAAVQVVYEIVTSMVKREVKGKAGHNGKITGVKDEL